MNMDFPPPRFKHFFEVKIICFVELLSTELFEKIYFATLRKVLIKRMVNIGNVFEEIVCLKLLVP